VRTLLIWCLVALPCAAADLTAMVWGGGATRADAEASLASFEARRKTWAGALALSKGFPQIVESSAVAGMKPGFVVVLLGYCSDAEAPATLELLKDFDTSIYARPVQGGAASCPKLGADFSRTATRVVKTKEGELRGLFLNGTGGLHLFLQLHSRAGVLLESAAFTPAQLQGEGGLCSASVAAEGLVVALECDVPRGCPSVGHVSSELRYRMKDGKLESKEVVTSRDMPPCSGE